MKTQDPKVRTGIDRVVYGLEYPQLPKMKAGEIPSKELIEEVCIQQIHFKQAMMYIKDVITLDPDEYVALQKKYTTFFLVKIKQTGEVYCDFQHGRCGKTYIANIGFNPDKLSDDGKLHFISLLDMCFNHGYRELFEEGIVSRIEFFIDVPDIEIDKYVLLDLGRKKSHAVKDTIYTGADGSPLVVTMYNKAVQLGIQGQLVRIEARVRRRDFHPVQFVTEGIDNPFSNAAPISRAKLFEIAEQMGVVNQYTELLLGNWRDVFKNKPAREKFIKLVRDEAPSWWTPKEYWASHCQHLQELLPNTFEKILYQ